MEVEWDPKKGASNLAKHGVAFGDAATALDDPFALTIEDNRFDEQRFITVASVALGHILVVATASEKKQYYGKN